MRITIAVCAAFFFVAAASASEVKREPYTLTGPGGAQAQGELVTLSVPENRANPNARAIMIKFVRLPATGAKPGFPVVYLAGGPGGSAVGNGQGVRFAFFNRLREVGDVILLEQRGTGLSDALPVCETQPFDPAQPLDRANLAGAYRRELARCIAFWRSKGADVAGYNTLESAADLDEVRRVLGVEKLNVVGLSYGTHLGMAALKRGVPVNRVVLAGLEGLDQTVKMPAYFNAFLARVAATSGDTGLLATMRRVHARLDHEPVTLSVNDAAGKPVQVRLGGFAIQLLASFVFISDPERLVRLHDFYAALDAGQFQPAADLMVRAIYPELSHMRGMPQLMDLASGVSRPRMDLVARQAATAILGDAGNFPMPHVYDVAPELVLGDDFRKPLSTDVPTLLVMGTMDGRTPIESQEELLPQFHRATRLTVVNAGHNIFEQSEAAQAEIVRFLQTGTVGTALITLPPPAFKR